MPRSLTRPPAESLAWVEASLGASARVLQCRRLTGGLTSLVHALTVERMGRREQYVLRRLVPDDSYREWAESAVGKEAAILARLEGLGIPSPRLVASTTDAAHGGLSVLMTRVPGRMSLMPSDRERWLRQMSQMLVRIHALDIEARPFESWLDRERLSVPPGASRPQVWNDAIALVREERQGGGTCFIHRDYQHFNLLWTRDRLTGVVDWIEACNGPPEVDVGHCRLNLTVLFSADVADRFRELYEVESGRRVDAWWDLYALMSYGPEWPHFIPLQVAGRAPFDAEGTTGRMEQVLERAIRRA